MNPLPRQSFRFDTESEMAAAVYQRGDHPDELLASFAAGLTARGFDVAGVGQAIARDVPVLL